MDKVSYLKGLLAGLEVNPESREGKVFYAVCEALEESAKYTEELENRVAELEELCNILDEDLGFVEEMLEDNDFNCTNCGNQTLQYDYISEVKDESSDDDTGESVEIAEDKSDDNDMDESVAIVEDESSNDDTDSPVEIAEVTKEMEEQENLVKPETGIENSGISESIENNIEEFLEDGEEEYETVCPTCGHCILLSEQMLEEGETVCPNCGEELEFDFDEEEIEKLAPADEE